jgi:hypothetical protein
VLDPIVGEEARVEDLEQCSDLRRHEQFPSSERDATHIDQVVGFAQFGSQ